jgi:TetR/AcrR family transcriptional repressor of uid operon
MARTRDEALHATRRQDILAAAARVFKAKGFHLARTEDICAEAGLSAGTLFRHFPDKRSMIVAIADVEFERLRSEIEQLSTKEGILWLTKITAEELAQLIEPKGFELGTDSWLELARDGEGRKRLLAVDQSLRQMISRQLEQGKAEGWIRKPVDSDGTAAILLALFSGLQLESEVGLAVDTQATAYAIADLFGGLLISRSSSTINQP